MQTIKTQNGTMAILSNKEAFPKQDWLDQLTIQPLPTGRWFESYPIGGGVRLVQEGTFALEHETTERELHIALTGICGDYFCPNPAAESIMELFRAERFGS